MANLTTLVGNDVWRASRHSFGARIDGGLPDGSTLASVGVMPRPRCPSRSAVAPDETGSPTLDVAPHHLIASARFVQHEIIGRGGNAWVIRAFDKDLHRDVAVKVMPAETATPSTVARLGAEARITGQLEHPSIIPVYECGVDDRGSSYLCMRLVQGETLEDTLEWAGPLRLEIELLTGLLDILARVCDATHYAHSRGVIHRDIKPSNVMSAEFGQVYLLDWGIARQLHAVPPSSRAVEPFSDAEGLMVGTPCYMAPEQLYGMNDRLDERTDVFGLGATLYQILAGRPPRDFTSPGRRLAPVWAKIPPLTEVVVKGSTPAALSRIAVKAMADDPRDRYQSVAAFKRAIEPFRL